MQYGGANVGSGVDTLAPTYSAHQDAGLSPRFSSPKIAVFEIRLDSDRSSVPGLYCSGQTFQATVHLEVKRPVKATGIVFQCEGKVRLGNRTRTESLFEKFVFGSAKSTQNQRLAIGVYDYPVDIRLPNDVLPSVECKGRYVTYHCRATIKRVLKKNAISVARPLTFHHTSEAVMNAANRSQEPVSETLETGTWGLSCNTERAVYSAGETIAVRGDVYNKTRSKRTVVVGLELVRVVRVSNEVFLGLVTFHRWCSGETSCDRQLAGPATVNGKNAWPFVLNLPIGRSLAWPTTSHPSVEISYKLRISVSCRAKVSLGKPKAKLLELPVVIVPSLPPACLAQTTSASSLRNVQQSPSAGCWLASPPAAAAVAAAAAPVGHHTGASSTAAYGPLLRAPDEPVASRHSPQAAGSRDLVSPPPYDDVASSTQGGRVLRGSATPFGPDFQMALKDGKFPLTTGGKN